SALALEALDKGRELQEKLVRENAKDPQLGRFQYTLAGFYTNISSCQRALGKQAAAERASQRACEVAEEMVRNQPANSQFQYRLADFLLNRAELLSQMGQTADAVRAQQRASDIAQKLARDSPNVAIFQSLLARSHFVGGSLHVVIGSPRQALYSF